MKPSVSLTPRWNMHANLREIGRGLESPSGARTVSRCSLAPTSRTRLIDETFHRRPLRRTPLWPFHSVPGEARAVGWRWTVAQFARARASPELATVSVRTVAADVVWPAIDEYRRRR